MCHKYFTIKRSIRYIKKKQFKSDKQDDNQHEVTFMYYFSDFIPIEVNMVGQVSNQ